MTRRPELVLVAALTAAGAALRFATLDLQSFWHDEAVTVGRVLDPSLFTTLDRVPGSEATPPLYYALAWAWTRVFGSGEVGIRSLSAVLGTATIPVAWWAGRELISRAAGVAAAALVAFSPYMVWYSQEARAYALLVLLCGLSLALFARALRGDSARWLGWWALVAALALVTHYFAVFVVAPELALLLWLMPARRRAVLLAGACVGAVGLALVPLAVHQANQGHDGWIERIALSTRLRDTGKQFVLGYSGSPARALSLLVALAVLVAAALAVWNGRRRRGFWLAAGIGVAALLIPLAAKALGADYVYPRNMIGAWVPLAVALAGAVAVGGPIGAQLQPRAYSIAGAGAIAAVCATFIALNVAVDTDAMLQRADWRAAAQAIGPAHTPRAIVVPAIGDDPVAYYAHATRLRHGAVSVAEIDVLGFSAAPRARDRRVPAGFTLVARRGVGRFRLARYRAERASAVTRPALAAARLGTGHAAVVVQRP
ncbi:MAG: glycosyltransferase family 39 protein [Thermoleophilaceae bacterium]